METATIGSSIRSALISEIVELNGDVGKVVAGLNDDQLWKKPLAQSNSVGHLILHLTGNLNHFVGAQLGHSSYVRDREREFTEPSPMARAQLIAGLDDAVATFRRVVGGLSDTQLLEQHPHQTFGTVLKCLIHLIAHFALHRGQMSYITRLVLAA